MCDSPTARNEFSIVLYPSSASPRTSATSIDLIANRSSSGTPSRSAARTRCRAASRSRAKASATGVSVTVSVTTRTSAGDSTTTDPTTPRRAAKSFMRASPGSRAASMWRTVPTNATRSATPHAGGASNTATDSSASGSPISCLPPASSMNTTSETRPTNFVGLTRYFASRSTAKPRSAKGAETFASIRARRPSSGTQSLGFRAASTVSSNRSPAPSETAQRPTRIATAAPLARVTRRPIAARTAMAIAPIAQPAAEPRHAAAIASAHAAHSTPDHREPPAIAQPSHSPQAKMQVVHGTTPRRLIEPSAASPSSPGMGSPGP